MVFAYLIIFKSMQVFGFSYKCLHDPKGLVEIFFINIKPDFL